MKQPAHRDWLWFTLMLAITAIVASTAVRIEWYNHAVGGFLPRPQPPSVEGNDVKWRAASPFMAERNYRQTIAWDQGIELSDDFEVQTKELNQIALTPEQDRELGEIKKHAKLNVEFRSLVGSMGLLQYLLVPLGIFLSVQTIRRARVLCRVAGVSCLLVNLTAAGLVIYREYLPSLGW